MSEKYPFLTAYVGFIALGTVLTLLLSFVVASVVGPSSAQLVSLIVTVVASFYIFRFVVRKNVLPYINQDSTSAATTDQQPEIVQDKSER